MSARFVIRARKIWIDIDSKYLEIINGIQIEDQLRRCLQNEDRRRFFRLPCILVHDSDPGWDFYYTNFGRDGHPVLRFNRNRVTARIFSGWTGKNRSFSTGTVRKIPGWTRENRNRNKRSFSTGKKRPEISRLSRKKPPGFSGSSVRINTKFSTVNLTRVVCESSG